LIDQPATSNSHGCQQNTHYHNHNDYPGNKPIDSSHHAASTAHASDCVKKIDRRLSLRYPSKASIPPTHFDGYPGPPVFLILARHGKNQTSIRLLYPEPA
jgi:hypothetical protein